MGETNTEKAPKTSWFTGLKAEFSKIIWPDKKSLIKQTTAVTVVSIILGLIIALIDAIIKYGVTDILVNL
ncbi:preprotein translocase subunit SecE [Roseburia sp. 499]|uniref:preprotein translocase subunit SecE n=1 Tax=Roseburia sp. 499 TaxID=1261634 RepID=UPI000951E49E|nr:preprotein translocase subunit SecE [Roseburia sp. 499]WVK70054.1 preprotein translocase subunit SecE [Roseburia sp. 499]